VSVGKDRFSFISSMGGVGQADGAGWINHTTLTHETHIIHRSCFGLAPARWPFMVGGGVLAEKW